MDLTNLISYWALNESSDGSVSVSRADSHGTNTLADVNTTPSTTGLVYPNAANLESANSEGFFINDNASLSVVGDIDFTLCCWVKFVSHTSMSVIISKGNDPDLCYALKYDIDASVLVFNVFSAAGGVGGAPVEATSLGALSDGVWYFIVCWRDSTDNKLRIQINNGTIDVSASTNTGGFDEAGEFDLGFTNGLGNFANVVLGPVLLWKRLLTTQEKTDLYNGGAGLTYAAMSATTGASNPWGVIQHIVRRPNVRVVASGMTPPDFPSP